MKAGEPHRDCASPSFACSAACALHSPHPLRPCTLPDRFLPGTPDLLMGSARSLIGCSTALGITTVQIEILGAKFQWGSPKASHIKAIHPHFPRFRVRIFRVLALWNLLRPLFFWGERGFPHFQHFSCIGFESLIWQIRLTGFNMTGLR